MKRNKKYNKFTLPGYSGKPGQRGMDIGMNPVAEQLLKDAAEKYNMEVLDTEAAEKLADEDVEVIPVAEETSHDDVIDAEYVETDSRRELPLMMHNGYIFTRPGE